MALGYTPTRRPPRHDYPTDHPTSHDPTTLRTTVTIPNESPRATGAGSTLQDRLMAPFALTLAAPLGKSVLGQPPLQLRPAQAPRPPDHRTHPAQPCLPGHRRRPRHRPVPHPADPAAPHPRPRPAHQPRTTRPQPTPASRPRLPRRPDRPRPAGIPRRLTPPAAITHSNHEPARACHQPSHTPQLDSKFKIPAGKDNLRRGLPERFTRRVKTISKIFWRSA